MTKPIKLFFLLNIIILFGFGRSAFPQESEVNIYSSLNFPQLENIFTNFSSETGIRVNIFNIEDSDLVKMQEQDQLFGTVDVFLTSGIQNILIASEAQVFEEFYSSLLEETIPDHLRDNNGKWSAYSYWPRVIIYNKALIDPLDVLTYESLSEPNLENMICVRSSSSPSNVSLLASIIENVGEENARNWAKGVQSNFSRNPQGGETDQILSVSMGECGAALIDYTYFLRLLAKEQSDTVDLPDKVGIIFPNQGGRGSIVNVSGGGVLKDAPNRENAVKFLLYLTALETQKTLANITNEYPVNKYVFNDQKFEKFKPFKMDNIMLSDLKNSFALAERIFKDVGWN